MGIPSIPTFLGINLGTVRCLQTFVELALLEPLRWQIWCIQLKAIISIPSWWSFLCYEGSWWESLSNKTNIWSLKVFKLWPKIQFMDRFKIKKIHCIKWKNLMNSLKQKSMNSIILNNLWTTCIMRKKEERIMIKAKIITKIVSWNKEWLFRNWIIFRKLKLIHILNSLKMFRLWSRK